MTAKTILFMPESAYGPTNNCIGIGHRLLERGHRVVFAAERSWAGRLEALGFEEDLVDLAPPPDPSEGEQDAGQFWTDFIRDTAPEFRKPTIEQLTTFVQPTWQALIDGARYCQPQLQEIIERAKPDVIVEDNVNCFPALLTAGVPFVPAPRKWAARSWVPVRTHRCWWRRRRGAQNVAARRRTIGA